MRTAQLLIQSDHSDADLLAAHAAGDQGAFEQLFRRHHTWLYQLACAKSRTPEDAADALQEAMLSVHRNAASFRRDSAVSSWLYRIVMNACMDRMRRTRLHEPLEADDTQHGVSDRTSEVDTSIVIQKALRRLPEDQRAAVVAVDMQGHSIAEAAALLGVPEGTVKSRCARARARLAAALHHLDPAV